jgi:hypothetical protein
MESVTTVEPIAALSPLLFLVSEWTINRFQTSPATREAVDEPALPAKNRKPFLRLVAVIAMIMGLLILGRV